MSVEAKNLIDLTRLSRFKELMDQSVDGKLSKLKIDLVQPVSVLPAIEDAEEGVLYLVPAKASSVYDLYAKETVDGVAKFVKNSSLFISGDLDGFLLKADAEKKYISAASVADDTITLSRPDGSTVVITVNNVVHATKADQDGNGAVIAATYVQTGAVDQTIGGTKTFSKPMVGSVTGSSGSCTGNAATATRANSAASADTATNATNSNAANQLQAFVNDDFTGGNHYVKAIRSSQGWSTHLWMCYNNGAKMADEVSVNYATNSGYTNWLRTSSHTDHLFHTEWDGTYFWTYVTAGDGGYRAVRVERSNSSGYADSAGSANTANSATTATYASRSANNGGFYINNYLITIG